MQAVDLFDVSATHGIHSQVKSSPLRQILILEHGTLEEFNLQPGDLRENMIVRDFDLYGLPSGSVVQVGGVQIALTFPCEPCNVIADKVNLKAIRHKRGYLGRFLNDGVIRAGDPVTVTDHRHESIPEIPVERITWYLNKIDTPIMAADLMWQVGLAPSYCRALPAMLRKHPEIDETKIIFQRQLL
jgi:MOSC domain-containing protein YiiM